MEERETQLAKLINQVLDSPEVPKFYANGFVVGSGSGDVLLLLQQNNKPIAAINLSFTMAKTLSIRLGDTIKHIEQDTGESILTTDEFEEAFTTRIRRKQK